MKRLNLINAISEAIIPLLGLFFFDWGIYFILLFYFIDLISTEVFVYIKVNKVIQFQRIKFPFSVHYGRLILNSCLVLAIIIVSHFAVYFMVENIHFSNEIIQFIEYEEAGIPIPQGYILFPLVILGNYMQYKTTFIKSGIYRISSWKIIILSRRRSLYIALIGGVLAIILAYSTSLPEFVYILAIVSVKFFIDYNVKKPVI